MPLNNLMIDISSMVTIVWKYWDIIRSKSKEYIGQSSPLMEYIMCQLLVSCL